jgi:hypothetical protein
VWILGVFRFAERISCFQELQYDYLKMVENINALPIKSSGIMKT